MGHCGDTIYMCADKLVFNKGACIILGIFYYLFRIFRKVVYH